MSKHVNNYVEIDDKLCTLEPLFNSAICIEQSTLTEEKERKIKTK